MSRVGKQAITIPSGAKAVVAGRMVQIEGPKGKLEVPIGDSVDVDINDGQVSVSTSSPLRQAKSNWGTTRSLIANGLKGVVEGWQRNLELNGVGFTATMSGNTVTLATGYSHKSDVNIPSGVECKVQKQSIALESCDKQLVGQVAAVIRAVCPPEPYLGKGIKYSDEVVRRKAGKTGAK